MGILNSELDRLRKRNSDLQDALDAEMESNHRLTARELELSTEGGIVNDRFDKAQQCINQIDDLLEYAYKAYDVEKLGDRIMGFIDDYGVLVSGRRDE